MSEEENIRYCYACKENVGAEWQKLKGLMYGEDFYFDVKILFCPHCGKIFETRKS